MAKGYMYILKCSDDSYYTGSTIDLAKRFEQHQAGEGANHTKKHLPVELVYFEEYHRIDLAFNREKQVQGWSRKKKEALISGHFESLSPLSMAYRDMVDGDFENLSPRGVVDGDFESLSPREVVDGDFENLSPREVVDGDFESLSPREVVDGDFESLSPREVVKTKPQPVAEALEATDATIADFCKQLGIDTPF